MAGDSKSPAVLLAEKFFRIHLLHSRLLTLNFN